MDLYSRHVRTFRILNSFLRPFTALKFHETAEEPQVDAPMLLIANHACAWDPLLVAVGLRNRQVYYVASEHLFRQGAVSKLINALVAPIPRRKASTGTDTVKACLRHLQAGHSVCLFAEGEQTWNGRSNPIFPATGKLAKLSGATLVTYRLEGNYLSLPRWGKGVRRGRVSGHTVGIYPPEKLKAMSPKEIDELIQRDITDDAWQRQRENPVRFRGKRRAEGMERALYLCPRCRRIGSLKTKDNRIFCDCGLDLEYTETGFFRPETPFSTLADWDDWQQEQLHARAFCRPDAEGPLFTDGGVSLYRVGSGHREEFLGSGGLLLYEDRLVCADRCFPLADTRGMADVLANRLLFVCGDEYYEIRSGSAGVNLRKYLEVWKEH